MVFSYYEKLVHSVHQHKCLSEAICLRVYTRCSDCIYILF